MNDLLDRKKKSRELIEDALVATRFVLQESTDPRHLATTLNDIGTYLQGGRLAEDSPLSRVTLECLLDLSPNGAAPDEPLIYAVLPEDLVRFMSEAHRAGLHYPGSGSWDPRAR
jgi:hypothetical protein